MDRTDWTATAWATAAGAALLAVEPAVGVTLLVITAGTAAFGVVMQKAARFDGI